MNSADDTIAAIATPLGFGGLGVVRLSGPQALKIAETLFETPSKTRLPEVPSHTLHHGWLKNNGSPIDEVVAGVFRAPHSYTGEDVVEFSCHGSPAVLKEIVRLCEQKGARQANPGEFTERAYLNGKMDLIQAEAVAQLIHSTSTAARLAATDQLRGALSERIRDIRNGLLSLLSHIEANLDFVEEDIPGLHKNKMRADLETVRDKIHALLSTSLRGRLLREGLRVAIVGKPNVGKSSLFNALLAQDRAIVTDVPGTTRDFLEEKMEWDGLSVVLIDTAGLRPTRDKIEGLGIERAKHAREAADVILLVLDASAPLTPDDMRIAGEADKAKTLGVLNKYDAPLVLNESEVKTTLQLNTIIKTSAKERTGLSDLKQAVLALAQKESAGTPNTPVVTALRHVAHLEKAQGFLDSALAAVQQSKSEEAIAMDVRAALDELGAITGETVGDEVLAMIFQQFCVGK